MNEPDVAPKAGRKEWIGLAVIALPCLLYSMDLTVLHLAVPALTRDLKPSSAQLLWIIDIYGFLVAGSLITAGTLGDRIGRRKLLFIGAGMFTVASVFAAFARTAEELILARAVLGIAGATVAPSTMSLIRNMFHDAQQRTTAVSVWIMAYTLGGAVGPLVGGIMLERFWWGSVFLLAVPVMALLLLTGPALLPEYRDPNAGKADVASAALSLAAVLAMIAGLKSIAQDGVSPSAIAVFVAGLGIGYAFVRRQLTLSDPLIDLRLFRVPGFSASVATYGLTIVTMFGAFLFLPQFLQLVVGLTPFRAGLWSIPSSAAFIVGSMVTPALARRFGAGRVMTAGLAVASSGYALVLLFDANLGFWLYFAATFLFAFFTAPVFTLTTDLVMSSAPPERAGMASAISETSAEFGGALGIAVYGSIGVAVYRLMMDGAVPVGVDVQAAEAARATLGGAMEVASGLSDSARAALESAARTAFTRGVQICAAIGTLGSIAMAIFVAATLAKRPATTT
jgi:DHA2 family multidrug resistance protein-like MFS transporter